MMKDSKSGKLIRELLNKAQSLEREGKVDDAVALYSRVLSLDSDNEKAKRKIYELKSVEMIVKLPNMVEYLDISRDRRYLALVYGGKMRGLVVVDLKDRREIFRVERPGSFFNIRWHPSGRYFATVSCENLEIWDFNSRRVAYEVALDKRFLTGFFIDFCWVHNGSGLTFGIDNFGFATIMDVMKKPKFYFDEHSGVVILSVESSPDGQFIAAHEEEAIYVYAIDKRGRISYVAHFPDPEGEAGFAHWGPKGDYFYIFEKFHTYIKIINFRRILEDYSSGRISELKRAYLEEHIDAEFFFHDVYCDGILYIGDYMTEEDSYNMAEADPDISYNCSTFDVSPSGRYLAAVYERTVGIWDLQSQTLVYRWMMRHAATYSSEKIYGIDYVRWIDDEHLAIVWPYSVGVLHVDELPRWSK